MSTPVNQEYIPTIIDSRALLPRLASELTSLQQDFKKVWPHFKRDPFLMTALLVRSVVVLTIARGIFAPHVLAAFVVVTLVTAMALLTDRARIRTDEPGETDNEVVSQMKLCSM